MSAFAGFAGVAMFLAAGLGISAWIPALRERGRLVRSAYGYLLGVAWMAGGAWLLSHAFGCPLRRTLFVALLLPPVGAGLLGILARRSARWPVAVRGKERSPNVPREPLAIAAFAVAGVVALGLFADAAAQPLLQFDDRVTWGAHARYLRAEHTVDARTIREGKWFVTLPRYPILLPLAQVAIQESFATDEEERVPRPLYAAFYPALLLILFDAAARQSGARVAALVVLGAALWPILITRQIGGPLTMLNDLPLGAFLGGGLALLLAEELSWVTGAAAGALLGAAVLSKNEGLPLAASVVAARVLMSVLRWWRERRSAEVLRREIAGLVPVALEVVAATVLLASWRSGIVDRMMGNFEQISRSGHLLTSIAQGGVERWPALILPALAKLADLQVWGFFWWSAALVLVAGARGLASRRALPLLIVLAGAWGTYLAALAVTEWTPAYLLALTFPRFLLQITVPTLLVVALALEDLFPEAPAHRG